MNRESVIFAGVHVCAAPLFIPVFVVFVVPAVGDPVGDPVVEVEFDEFELELLTVRVRTKKKIAPPSIRKKSRMKRPIRI